MTTETEGDEEEGENNIWGRKAWVWSLSQIHLQQAPVDDPVTIIWPSTDDVRQVTSCDGIPAHTTKGRRNDMTRESLWGVWSLSGTQSYLSHEYGSNDLLGAIMLDYKL